MRISESVTPREVCPPLSPSQYGTHGGDCGSSIWRGGSPMQRRTRAVSTTFLAAAPGTVVLETGAVVVVVAAALPPVHLVRRAAARMDAVIDGSYETGVPPFRRFWNPGDDPGGLRKIDDAHFSDRTIYELVSHPAIGDWAADVTGAAMVQVWSVQL